VSELLDSCGYPTDEVLERIRKWELKYKSDYYALMALVKSIWAYPQCFKKYGDRYTLVTLGWSGNEDIIHALHSNAVFYLICWKSSERGGRYVYEPSGVKFLDEVSK
jgi:hypothetical protein